MKKFLILFAFVLLAGSSCNEWLDVNTDPNNPTEVPADLVLPNAQMQIAGSVGGDYAILGGIWAQHWTQSHIASQYKDIDSYDLTDKDFEIDWSELYSDALVDLAEIKTKSSAAGEWNSYLQATCLEAYTYQILADLYDKVPCKEAVQGSANLTPKFDDGEAIYDELFTRINAALAKDFNAATVVKVTSDLIFGSQDKSGQIDSWKRFANTLKLKMLLRQTESSRAADATQKINNMLSSGTAFLTGHAAISIFIDEANRSNPLYENNVRQLNVATNIRASYTLMSLLQANNDPRLDAYFVPGSAGHFALAQGDFNELTSVTPGARPSSAKFSATTPFYFFSADEVDFMLAEASLRTGASVENHYYNGIKDAFAKFGLTAPQNLLDNAYKFPTSGTTAEKLEAIITQKWMASVNQGYESYFDQNRTGYPRISNVPASDASYVPGRYTYSIEGVTSGKFPKRLIFPDLSRRVNPNTPAFVAITEKVWWAK